MASSVFKPNYDFQLEWMKDYKWATSVKHDKYKAYCALCNVTLNISRNGHYSLLQHEKSKAHYRNLLENDGEYRHGANNCASDTSFKMETINDSSSVETVSLNNPQVSLPDRNDEKSLVLLTKIPILHQTNLSNPNSTVDDSQNTSETLDSVRNTHKSNNGSRSDLLEINGCSENNSKFTLSDETKNSSPELLDTTTPRATVSSTEREPSICAAYKDNKLFDVSIFLEPISIGTNIDKHSNHLSTPGSSKAMKQTDEKIEMKFEIDNSYPSTPTEQATYSDHLNSRTGMNATHRNAEMARETPEVHFVGEAGNTESFNRRRSCGGENTISTRLLAYSNTYGSETDESGLSKRRCLPVHSHSISRDKSHILNEIRSILKRLDEEKLVYENKCRTIMEDYKILLNKLSEESDPTFLTSEHASSWNSLKLIRMLYSEANNSEKSYPESKENNIDGQPANNSNSNENFSTSRTRGFLHNGHTRKRGRPKKQVQHSQ